MNLTNKTVVITGAANGLGKALAIEFFHMGCNLALCDIDKTELLSLQKEFQNNNQIISLHLLDVSIEEAVKTTCLEILDKHKKVDTLINNAGVSISQSFELMSTIDFKWLFEINFWGTVYFTKYLLSHLKSNEESHIANIISNFATHGFPGKIAYTSSKAATLAFTNSLYTELSDTGILLSYVIPPAIKTNIIMRGKHSSEIKMQNEYIYLNKNGMPADVVAKRIIAMLLKNKYKIVIGNKTFWIDLLSRWFPVLFHKLIIRSKRKFDFI